jgi:hypothetical protein
MSTDASTYRYHTAQPAHMHEVFVPPVIARLQELKPAWCRSVLADGTRR